MTLEARASKIGRPPLSVSPSCKDDYESGMTIAQVAVKHRVSYQTAFRALAAYGTKMRPPGLPRKSIPDDLREMWERPMTSMQLAVHYGVSDSLVHEWLARLGLKRTRGVTRSLAHARTRTTGDATPGVAANSVPPAPERRRWFSFDHEAQPHFAQIADDRFARSDEDLRLRGGSAFSS